MYMNFDDVKIDGTNYRRDSQPQDTGASYPNTLVKEALFTAETRDYRLPEERAMYLSVSTGQIY